MATTPQTTDRVVAIASVRYKAADGTRQFAFRRDTVALTAEEEARLDKFGALLPAGESASVITDPNVLPAAAPGTFTVDGEEADVADWLRRTNADDVSAFLAEHPEHYDAVIAAETEGRARKGVLALERPAGTVTADPAALLTPPEQQTPPATPETELPPEQSSHGAGDPTATPAPVVPAPEA